MFCAISGSVPEEPVVSSKSGHVFEKRLVEKHIQSNGKCPVSGEELSVDDLVAVKATETVKPRATPATSIPGLLGLFHNEWDALMLETHQLRTQLHSSRQELSHALYQHDAACRVIARLVRERDAARAACEELQAKAKAAIASAAETSGKRAAEDAEDEAAGKRVKTGVKAGVTSKAMKVMTETNSTLSAGRKRRPVQDGLATPADIEGLREIAKQPLHATSKGGILALSLHPGTEGVVASAGNDATIKVFDSKAGRIVADLSGHGKKVTDVSYLDANTLLSTSADKTVRVWRSPQDDAYAYTCASVITDHSVELSAAAVHPSRQYFATAGTDGSWCFHDVAENLCMFEMKATQGVGALTSMSFHPDGLLLAAGSAAPAGAGAANVHVWEMRQQKPVVQLPHEASPVHALAFSENGWIMASAAPDGVRLWDLRKIKNIKTIKPYGDDAAPTALHFDTSGHYLTVGGADARVYGMKQEYQVIKTFPDMPKKGVRSVLMGPLAKSIYVGSADHNLRIYGVPSES